MVAESAKNPAPPVELDFSREGINVIPRSLWTSFSPSGFSLRNCRQYDRLTVHHTGSDEPVFIKKDDDAVEALNNILQGHLERKFEDIGYHFVIDYTGKVWEGRSIKYEGVHVQNQNEGNIGIALFGSFEIQEPSGEQLDSLFRLISGLRRIYSIKLHRIFGHKDIGKTLCPGVHLYKQLERYRQ